MRISHIILVTLLSVTFSWGQGEGIVLEQLAAKLGGEILLSSEIQSNLDYQEAVNGGLTQTQECQVVEDLFLQKLLIDQAKVDSVIVAPEQVEGQLQAKIDYILQTMNGDVERFQNYYGKTVTQVKNMMRKDLSDQMMANQMRSKILENVQITPREVINYFESIPQDSLPFFNAEVEVGELLMFPEVNQDERDKAIAQIVDIQNQIEDGVSFNELARKHSDDPGSARMGGDLGWQARGQFVPEFEAAAFNLENGEISDIVESEFGFHLIRLLERRGNRIHVEHILIKPEITEADVEKASAKLDSIRTLILRDSVPWEIAVRKFGSDKTQSFHNGGRMTNPKTGNTFFETPDVETDVFFAIDTLDVGGVTRPIEQYDQYSRSYSLRIIKLFSRSKPHTANLGEDYDKIKTAAVQQRQQMYLDQWLDGKITETFIEINPEYISECETMEKWRRVNLFTSQP
ncbi:peptidylprolyl isomerase [Membranihabitans maritimus]|uniref:peptidylprolyl isomerase n=1 Tax=Membranihabitans maritimus TaxID=2904244 RepID=UPI001F00800A|nr:peptidylprolyl isomerase [Membranihabitans maritimus]